MWSFIGEYKLVSFIVRYMEEGHCLAGNNGTMTLFTISWDKMRFW